MSNEYLYDANRADALCSTANECISNHDVVRAADLVREANSIVPNHAEALRIIQSLHGRNAASRVPGLCSALAQEGPEAQGQEALRELKQNPRMTDSEGSQCAESLLSSSGNASIVIDELFAVLLSSNEGARALVATRFLDRPTETFEQLWHRGDRSMGDLTALLLDKSVASSPDAHVKVVQSLFQLVLSKLIDAGQECPERAITAVARLLATEPETLSSLVDADTFEIIVPFLHVRLSASTRSQATLAVIKLLKITKGSGEQHLGRFVAFHVNRGRNEDLILAFSAAIVAFSVVPTAAATFFTKDNFLPTLVPKLELNSSSPEDRRSRKLERVTLELLSAACVDKGCREAINKSARAWLQATAESTTERETAGLAALVLSKLQTQTDNAEPQQLLQLTSRLTGLTLRAENDAERQSAIEGLAYASLDASVKEEIIRNSKLMQSLVNVLSDKESPSTTIYGCITVLMNITTYRPAQSDEQKRVNQVRAYANAQKPNAANALDDDGHVTARCRQVMECGAVDAIVKPGRGRSTAVLTAMVQIMQSVSREPKHRGVLAQKGVVRFVLQAIGSLSGAAKEAAGQTIPAKRVAAHALARILISTNPNHIFSAALPAISSISPLVELLTPDPGAEQTDLLPTFEALLALTNLASMEDDSVRERVIRGAWQVVEDLLLSNNTLVQRAAVELVCNLMASPSGVAKFADGSKQASHRMHILLALADVEDLATRRAAGGALAMLTEWDAAVKAILDKDRGVRIILGMCEDDSAEMRHRGVVCLLNIVSAPGEAGKDGLAKIKAVNGADVLRTALQKSKDPQVLQAGITVLKKLS